MTRRRNQRLTRGVVALIFATAALATFAAPAYAEAPARVGWWNTVSAGGAAAPAPMTPSGGMHVASGPGQVLAYGAVLYPMPAQALLGRLTFTIAGSQGTVALLACPTKTSSWPGGDDQPPDKAPDYDCSKTRVIGAVSSDGKSVTFTLTALPTGVLSVAIIPDLSGNQAPVNQPFSVDLDKPSASSFEITTTGAPQAAAGMPLPTTQAPPPAAAPASAANAGRPLGVPNVQPPSSGQAMPPAYGIAPQIASGAPPSTSVQTQPTAATSRSVASTVGSIIGALALVAAFMFWGLGRGLLGGRIMPLSIPTRSAES